MNFNQEKLSLKKASKNLFKRIAPVSKNESSINYKLNLINLNKMRHWGICLKEYIQELKLNEK